MIKPYKIEEYDYKGTRKWVIRRYDKSIVNEMLFDTLEDANAYLDRLRQFGWDMGVKK